MLHLLPGSLYNVEKVEVSHAWPEHHYSGLHRILVKAIFMCFWLSMQVGLCDDKVAEETTIKNSTPTVKFSEKYGNNWFVSRPGLVILLVWAGNNWQHILETAESGTIVTSVLPWCAHTSLYHLFPQFMQSLWCLKTLQNWFDRRRQSDMHSTCALDRKWFLCHTVCKTVFWEFRIRNRIMTTHSYLCCKIDYWETSCLWQKKLVNVIIVWMVDELYAL